MQNLLVVRPSFSIYAMVRDIRSLIHGALRRNVNIGERDKGSGLFCTVWSSWTDGI